MALTSTKNKVDFAKGSQGGYNSLGTYDSNTLYFCKDSGNLYLGDELLNKNPFVSVSFDSSTKTLIFTTQGSDNSGVFNYTKEIKLDFATVEDIKNSLTVEAGTGISVDINADTGNTKISIDEDTIATKEYVGKNYLPLSGGTVTGNIKQSNPMVNIGGGFEVYHGSYTEKIFKFFSITLHSENYSQNQCFDITYATKTGGRSWGHLFIKTSQGSTVATAAVTFYNRVDIGSNDNQFYYVRSSDTVVDFYYKANDFAGLTLVDIKSGRQNINKATFYNTLVSSLPSGAVQASRASFGGSTGSIGSSTVPIYVNSSGQPATCSTYAGGTSVTLNGTSKASTTASFYAPTTAGTEGYVLTSNGSGEPSWKDSTIYWNEVGG